MRIRVGDGDGCHSGGRSKAGGSTRARPAPCAAESSHFKRGRPPLCHRGKGAMAALHDDELGRSLARRLRKAIDAGAEAAQEGGGGGGTSSAVAEESQAEDGGSEVSGFTEGTLAAVRGEGDEAEEALEEQGFVGSRVEQLEVGPAAGLAARAAVRQRPLIQETQLPQSRLDFWRETQEDDSVGNVGFLFGNWGNMPANRTVRQRVEMQLKSCPAQIVGLAECEEATKELLSAEGAAADPQLRMAAEESGDHLAARPKFEYLVIKARGVKSPLLAARAQMAHSVICLHDERKPHGQYSKRGGGKGPSISKVLVCKVCLDKGVGHFGKEIVVMVVHMHNVLANNQWPSKLGPFWDWIYGLCVRHEVTVLMGDFNMSFFRVIPELRSRGAEIDLAAWYPWKTEVGGPAADSCGIFFLNKPGTYKLCTDATHLHADTPQGYLYRTGPPPGFAEAAVAADRRPTEDDPYHTHIRASGPGQTLDTYLPKKGPMLQKLGPSFDPSRGSAVARDKVGSLAVQEKRLDPEAWKIGGQHYKGSHFPVIAFTANRGRRSPDALERRHEKSAAKYRRAFGVPMPDPHLRELRQPRAAVAAAAPAARPAVAPPEGPTPRPERWEQTPPRRSSWQDARAPWSSQDWQSAPWSWQDNSSASWQGWQGASWHDGRWQGASWHDSAWSSW